MTYFDTLFIEVEFSSPQTIDYILLIGIGLQCILSWILFFYFIVKSFEIQISYIGIFCFLISLSLSLIFNIFYYVIRQNISHSIYQIQTLMIPICYAVGHVIMIIIFLKRVKASLSSYYTNKSCCNYSNIFIITSFIILPIPFLCFCIMTIIPSFKYITLLFSVWMLFELFVIINVIYLYLHQLSYLHHLKYNNNELNLMIRSTWNIIWTLLISFICILSIVYNNSNILSHFILSINIFISIVCITSFIDAHIPFILKLCCNIGDYLCGCCYCCCCDITKDKRQSFVYNHNEYASGRSMVTATDNKQSTSKKQRKHSIQMTVLKVKDSDSDSDDQSVDSHSNKNENMNELLIDNNETKEENESLVDIQQLKQNESLADIQQHKQNEYWCKLNANTFEIRPKGYYSAINKKRSGAKMMRSKAALYEVFEINGYKINIDKYGKKHALDENDKINTEKIDSNALNLPYFIVINILLPLKDNGKELNGMQLCIKCKLSEESQQILKQNENILDSMRLLSKFIDAVTFKEEDDIKNAFRLQMRINNLSETSLPFMIKTLMKKGNGKTLAVKKKGIYSMKTENGLNKCFIIDIDGYQLSKQINSVWNKVQTCLDSIVYDIGFFVGAREIGNFHEQILICTRINKWSVDNMLYKYD